MCLDANGGASVHLWSCDANNPNQRWSRHDDGTIRWDGNGLCLDTADDSYSNGARLQLWSCSGAGIPRWDDGGLFPRVPVASGKQIQVAGTNSCIDITDAGVANGTRVQMWNCLGNAAQTWRWSDGLLRAYNNYAKCLAADTSGGLRPGSRVLIADCSAGSSNQIWSRTGSGAIASGQTGLCLDTPGTGYENSAPLQLWDCAATAVPIWTENGALPLPAISSAKPSLAGKAAVGQTLRAETGAWTAGTAFAYKWLVNGSAVNGAVQSTFIPTQAHAGMTVTVAVTGSLAGYVSSTRTSSPSAIVVGGVLTSSTPTIAGAAVVGQVLTAKPGTWTSGTKLTYQWFANGKAISGATSSEIQLNANHADKSMSVAIAGEKAGFTSASRTSKATASVRRALGAAVPKITGSAVVGRTMSAHPGSWTSGATFTYQWAADGRAIAGATKSTITLTSAHAGTKLTVAVTGRKPGYTTVTRTSLASGVVTGGTLKATTPTISGTAVVGKSLTAKTGAWTPGVKLAYRWYAGSDEIPGATTPTLKLTSAHAGKKISVLVSGSKLGFTPIARKSAATASVLFALSSAKPTISGQAIVGSTLTARVENWTTGAKLTYQWSADGAPIRGAVHTTFKLTDRFAGKRVTVAVTGTRAGYTSATEISAASTAVLKVLSTSTPTISGTAIVGGKLVAKAGSWTSGSTLKYQWLASGSSIRGATSSTFTLTADQAGKAMTVVVTGSKTGYATTSKSSKATATVLRSMSSTAPAITGTAVEGQTLGANPGKWTAGAQITYQWLSDGKAIAGATQPTLKLGSLHVGKTISVRAAGSKSGYASAIRTSASTPRILRALRIDTPTVTGTPRVGQTLKANMRSWTPGTTLRYQWLANDSPIPGATSTTLILGTAQAGKTLRVRVTGEKSGYGSTSRTSIPTVRVPLLTFTTSPSPTVTGSTRPGSTLIADAGSWHPQPVILSYQWLRNGAAISGAMDRTYLTTIDDVNASISVRVSAGRVGYATVERTSPSVHLPAATELRSGETLTAGAFVSSPSSAFALMMQSDGALVLLDVHRGSRLWSTPMTGAGSHAVLQGDGNFVVYDAAGGARWASDSRGNAVTLRVHDDGNVVIYEGGSAVWTRLVVGWITVAQGATTGFGRGTQGMPAPTLNGSINRIYPPGARLAVVCGTTSGQPVDGAATPGVSRTATWHRLANGDWVPDADFVTGVNGLIPGEPHC
ncbi:ricin-type beta-trefoil lectin domain protein [Microbacterium sp. LX3-4]|uniref:Ricin-type beta-trefoil lectin domain protein n=2 Tax=Microbacterium dauci TaxID=3048008 RepID=A0ABT6ZE52_9MICO|nr:ricin-type beta-trefoil lectin domain protein [Microbacterium sp. LX3-4]MDJ1114444.1 ricin-type beta-trefoil lectin domain protein [Microbacterium sp. LX3-4]